MNTTRLERIRVTAGAFVPILLCCLSRGNDRKVSGVAIFEVRDWRSSRDPNFLPVFVTFWNVLRADHVRICFYRVFLFRFLTAHACDQILKDQNEKGANSKFKFQVSRRDAKKRAC